MKYVLLTINCLKNKIGLSECQLPLVILVLLVFVIGYNVARSAKNTFNELTRSNINAVISIVKYKIYKI